MITEYFESPFESSKPVMPERFKGREESVNEVLRYMPTVINQGTIHHFFVTGKKGMGKTSFVKYLSKQAEDIFQMIPIYINNNGHNSVDELIELIMDGIYKELNNKTWGKKIVNFLTSIDEINIKGNSIKFNHETIEDTKNNFSNFLISLSQQLDDKKGFFIVIDDINGISDDPTFTSWYKSFSESIYFAEKNVPIAFTLVSYLETFDKLTEINSSFARMFKLIQIDNLYEEDIEKFFIDVFGEYSIKFIDKKALDSMTYYSWGMPLVMQQIGDSTFWNVENNTIDLKTANMGIIKAAFELGEKQIRLKLKKIRSNYYENILAKICEHESLSFKKSEVMEYLDSNEKKVFNDCLIRLKNLEIIESVGRENSGEYEFTNRLYFVYFLINSKFKKYLIEQLEKGEITKREFDKYY